MCSRVAEKVKACCKCDLCKVRKNPVPGEGDEGAEVVFVGEAPGKEEDEEGRPFIGRAGKLLRSTISQIGFEKYYITNVVKCRPPGNRTPTKEEVEACKPYLLEELNCIRPKLVVALGRTAAETLLGVKSPLKEIRGKVFVTSAGGVQLKVLVSYHPAAVLRNPKLKEQFVHDLKKAFNEVYKQRSLLDLG